MHYESKVIDQLIKSAMDKNLLKYSRIYSFVKRQVMFTFKHFYGEYIVSGQENIPIDVPVIYAANHTNALMDPLAVISVLPKDTQIVYLARSDYFKNERIGRILRFFKIIPAFRMREGIENIDKNYEMFEQCVDVLNNNQPLGIMPEGNQGPLHKIRPLKKGIFRIAFAAQQKYGEMPGVKIVPIGIDYGNPDKFGDYLVVNIGKPIEVAEYMAEYQVNQVKGINKLQNKLSSELKKLTIHFSTTDYYECFENISRSLDSKSRKRNNLLTLFAHRQRIAMKLNKAEEKKSQLLENISGIVAKFHNNLNKLQLKPWIFNDQKTSAVHLFVTLLLLIFTLPIFFIGLVLNFLPFVSPDVILKLMKLKMPGGLGSLRFGVGLITFPLFYLLQGFLMCKKLKDNLLYIILFVPLQYVFGRLSFLWYKSYNKFIVKIRFRLLRFTKSDLLKETEGMYQQLSGLISNI